MGELNTFPVSYRVEGRHIVIVGGDDEALNKARLAVRTTATVVVVCSRIDADFSGLGVVLHERPFVAADLDGAALCFVADEGADGTTAKAAARAAGVPLNVVDVPEECDFLTPSIVDRAPLTVAIASEGDSPVLARLVRATIEAALSPKLGRLAALAGAMRERVMALVPGATERRRYFEALVTSPSIEVALEAGRGREAAEALLESRVRDAAEAGVVWLIGAGPGAEDLLTLRAQRLLQQADVIVHDQLVPTAVVDMGRRDAQRISVGKKKGHHSFTQAQINALIVRLGREGKRVARLKGGDPMILGRAGEEIAALRKAGVAYQIVPGVTAAIAAAADTATPLTLRQVSTGVVFATAHGASNTELKHWAALAGAGLTLSLYMGKTIAAATAGRLIGQGASATLPVGIVVNAGRDGRVLYRGTLGEVGAGSIDFADGPAIIFIGEAVAAGDWEAAIPLAQHNFRVA